MYFTDRYCNSSSARAKSLSVEDQQCKKEMKQCEATAKWLEPVESSTETHSPQFHTNLLLKKQATANGAGHGNKYSLMLCLINLEFNNKDDSGDYALQVSNHLRCII